MCTLLTPIKRFLRIYKKNFLQSCAAGYFADLAVLSSVYAIEMKLSFIITRVFFVGYV